MEDDLKSAFSSVPHGVFHIEDIRVYTHYNIEELGSSHVLNLYNKHLIDINSKVKPEFLVLEEKGFA